MLGFIGFLTFVLIIGFAVATSLDGLKKRTVPQPDELTTQLAGVSSVEVVEQQPRYASKGKNSQWFTHTFERPRRKVKR